MNHGFGFTGVVNPVQKSANFQNNKSVRESYSHRASPLLIEEINNDPTQKNILNDPKYSPGAYGNFVTHRKKKDRYKLPSVDMTANIADKNQLYATSGYKTRAPSLAAVTPNALSDTRFTNRVQMRNETKQIDMLLKPFMYSKNLQFSENDRFKTEKSE